VIAIFLSCMGCVSLGYFIGYLHGFDKGTQMYDEICAASHARQTVNSIDKIRIPATRSTDVVPEKLT
jgi:hypothetical protein